MKQSRSEQTRNNILNTAESLFVQYGYEGTSLRQLTSEAKVNLAAIHYHFGSKESLVHAVLKRRLEWINQERLRILDELEHQAMGHPLKPSQIVDAFFGTLLRQAMNQDNDNAIVLRLLARTMSDPSRFIKTLFAQEHAEVIDRYKAALFKALPGVPEAEILWRFHFMLGATSHALAGINVLREATDLDNAGQDHPAYDENLLPRLMSFLLGGLRAPLPPIA
ncbi:TetR/AcrR family transcriptional regulator [Advenella sp. RU8]|uniref:TetR/AcrR family transcriptional regulator n=1 Tax=Advenella sp. RU8 TaxID=3399575 RepID=UPI003AAB2364